MQILSLILLVYLNFNSISAQTNASIWDDIKEDAVHSYHAGIGLVKSPLTASTSDWLKIGYAGAATASLFIIDPEIKDMALSNRSNAADWLLGIDKYYNKEYVIVYTSGLYVSGLLMRNYKLRRAALHTIESVIVASSITATLKRVFGRSRPYTNDDQTTFSLFDGRKSRHRSLPSGHATGSFAFTTVMAKSIDNTWWKIFWYGTGTMVCAARIYHNRHWLSDTV
ncbi:MAG: phosphatase PAP2 family protein, partial [Calditrichaceae bacterium]